MRRRCYLALLGGTALSASLAGCGQEERRSPTPPSSPTDTPTESPTAPPTGTATQSPTDSPTESPTKTRADRPVVFLPPARVGTVRRYVGTRGGPWRTAYRDLVERANQALRAKPRSVVDNGGPAGEGPNKYGSDAPYQNRDGVYSDDINRQDYQAGLDMGDWTRTLAQTYLLSGEDRYARKAVELLHHWFVDDATRMYPSANNFGPHTSGLKSQNSIELFIVVPELLYAAALLDGHPHWDTFDRGTEAVREWTRTWQESLLYGSRGGPTGDEIYKWWVTTRAVTAAYLGDRGQLESAFEEWRTNALRDFEPRGSFEYARQRSRGLYYSLSALNALTYCAEIAANHGVDLYGYTGDGSEPVLRRAHDFHAPFVRDPSSWRWQELDGLSAREREYGVVSYELSYARRGVSDYLDVVEAVGRPVSDWRILGPVSLTHGEPASSAR